MAAGYKPQASQSPSNRLQKYSSCKHQQAAHFLRRKEVSAVPSLL
uniref:CRAT n=1 Tax=Mesocestoides corti TaxID=53468 RepID=A0A5K3FL09_MESCO